MWTFYLQTRVCISDTNYLMTRIFPNSWCYECYLRIFDSTLIWLCVLVSRRHPLGTGPLLQTEINSHSFMWSVITLPCSNLNDGFEIRALMSVYFPQFYVDVIIYPAFKPNTTFPSARYSALPIWNSLVWGSLCWFAAVAVYKQLAKKRKKVNLSHWAFMRQ